MSLMQKRNGLMDQAQNILNSVNGRKMTDEERTQLKSITSQVKELDQEINQAKGDEQLLQSFAGLTREGEKKGDDGERVAAATLGEHFVKHAHEKMLAVKGISGATVSAPEFKAATDVHTTENAADAAGALAPYNTLFDWTIVKPFRRRPFVTDLVNTGTLTNANAITYLVEGGAAEGDFAMVPEGGAKPQIHFPAPTTRTDALRKIAAFMKFTDEMIEDWGFLVSEINNRALYMLAMKEEAQILNGDGTGQNLTGLLRRSGIQTETSASKTDNFDALYRAMGKILNVTGVAADGVVMNPVDYQQLRLAKDANGQYLAGGPFQGQYGNGGIIMNPDVWGLPVVVTPAIPAGTALVAAMKQGKTLYRKGGVRVESTNSHVDDFTNNLVTVRIEERIGLADRMPAATCQVTLSNA